MSRFRNYLLLVVFVLILNAPQPAHATSIYAISFEQIARSSELVFEGFAVGQRIVADGPGDAIHTYVTFQIVQVIKGKYAKPTIEFQFYGGKIGDLSRGYADITAPKVGEHGIYFIESLSRKLLDPRIGIDQGHYLILNDPMTRTDRVYSRNHQPVIGFQPNISAAGMSTGVAVGLITSDSAEPRQALTPSVFAQMIREASRQ